MRKINSLTINNEKYKYIFLYDTDGKEQIDEELEKLIQKSTEYEKVFTTKTFYYKDNEKIYTNPLLIRKLKKQGQLQNSNIL